jgi:hypothetical protein
MADAKLDRITAPPDVADMGASLSTDGDVVAAPAPADDAPQPPSDAFENAGDLSKVEQSFKDKQTDDEKAVALIALVESGMSVREAATETGANIRTAYRVLARSEIDVDNVRATVRKLMIGNSLQAMEHWQTAMDVGARKKGNHAPARDWLLHAGVIDELKQDSGNVRVSIHIGTDERPMRIPSPLTIAAQCEEE